jgi:hypothetical protein
MVPKTAPGLYANPLCKRVQLLASAWNYFFNKCNDNTNKFMESHLVWPIHNMSCSVPLFKGWLFRKGCWVLSQPSGGEYLMNEGGCTPITYPLVTSLLRLPIFGDSMSTGS